MRDADLIGVLVRHGMSDRAAQSVEVIGKSLREQTLRTGREAAVLLDAASGEEVGRAIHGNATRFDIGAHVDAMQPGRAYVQLHTHPRSSSFSAGDLALFASYPRLRVMAVVGTNGVWYVLSDAIPGRALLPSHLVDAYIEELFALTPRYRALLAAGALTSQDADHAGRHEALQTVATRFRLRYDRVG